MNDIFGNSTSLLQICHHDYIKELEKVTKPIRFSKAARVGHNLRKQVIISIAFLLIKLGKNLHQQYQSQPTQLHTEQA